VLENIFGTSTRRVNIDQMDPIEVEPSYQGPHLNFPLTIDNVMLMLEHFKRGSVLHIKVRRTCTQYRRTLRLGCPAVGGGDDVT
jgi:hypothetical protein